MIAMGDLCGFLLGLTVLRLHTSKRRETRLSAASQLRSGASDGDFIEEVVVEELECDDAVEVDDEEVSIGGYPQNQWLLIIYGYFS